MFCVPRYGFEQWSKVFAGMFLLPAGTDAKVEGQDKEHPIVLEGYKADELGALLKVMYPKYAIDHLSSLTIRDADMCLIIRA